MTKLRANQTLVPGVYRTGQKGDADCRIAGGLGPQVSHPGDFRHRPVPFPGRSTAVHMHPLGSFHRIANACIALGVSHLK